MGAPQTHLSPPLLPSKTCVLEHPPFGLERVPPLMVSLSQEFPAYPEDGEHGAWPRASGPSREFLEEDPKHPQVRADPQASTLTTPDVPDVLHVPPPAPTAPVCSSFLSTPPPALISPLASESPSRVDPTSKIYLHSEHCLQFPVLITLTPGQGNCRAPQPAFLPQLLPPFGSIPLTEHSHLSKNVNPGTFPQDFKLTVHPILLGIKSKHLEPA